MAAPIRTKRGSLERMIRDDTAFAAATREFLPVLGSESDFMIHKARLCLDLALLLAVEAGHQTLADLERLGQLVAFELPPLWQLNLEASIARGPAIRAKKVPPPLPRLTPPPPCRPSRSAPYEAHRSSPSSSRCSATPATASAARSTGFGAACERDVAPPLPGEDLRTRAVHAAVLPSSATSASAARRRPCARRSTPSSSSPSACTPPRRTRPSPTSRSASWRSLPPEPPSRHTNCSLPGLPAPFPPAPANPASERRRRRSWPRTQRMPG
jgi:hypothetical protein